jgi:predicted HTH transcriptional regulator
MTGTAACAEALPRFTGKKSKARRNPLLLGGNPSSVRGKKSSAKASSPKGSPKTEDQIIELIKQDDVVSTDHLVKFSVFQNAQYLQIHKLKTQGRLKRVGPARGGHWEVAE